MKRKENEVETDSDFMWELTICDMPPSVKDDLKTAYEKLPEEQRATACERLDEHVKLHGNEDGAKAFLKEVEEDQAEEKTLLSIEDCLKLIEGMSEKPKRRRR